MTGGLTRVVNGGKGKFHWGICIGLLLIFLAAHHHIPGTHNYLEQFRHKEAISDAQSVAEAAEEGNLKRRIAIVSLGILGVWNFFRRRTGTVKIKSLLSILIILFALWSVLSLTWAENTGLTFRRVVILLMFGLGALGIARNLSSRDIVSIAFACSLIIFIVGLFAEVTLISSFRPYSAEYRFCGTCHPNHQGWNLAVLIFSATILASEYPRRKNLLIATALFAFVCLVLTKSRIAFVGTVFVMVMYWGMSLLRRNKYLLLACVCFFISLTCISYFIMQDRFFEYSRSVLLLGRGSVEGRESVETLSGRIPLWKKSLEFASERPFLGYGYDAFWVPERLESLSEVLGWGITGTHNGYLNLVLGTGVIGAGLFISILFMGLRRLTLAYEATSDRYLLFGIMILVFYSLVMLGDMISSVVCLPNFLIAVVLANLAFVVPAAGVRTQTIGRTNGNFSHPIRKIKI